jgi:hypothetical protein
MVAGVDRETVVNPAEGNGRPPRGANGKWEKSTPKCPIVLPPNTPLTFEQAARCCGVRLKQARRYMAEPSFKEAFDAVLASYRASLEPGNIAMALSIRDDTAQPA